MQAVLSAIDLDGWLKIATFLFTVISWRVVNSKRPKLEAFCTHVAAHKMGPQGFFTHALVIRNSGSAPAKNVHITHIALPANLDIQVYPPTLYQRNPVAGFGDELVFETLPAKHQITISYLYDTTATYQQMGINIVSDEGPTFIFPTTFARIIPGWVKTIVFYFLFAGVLLNVYWILSAVIHFLRQS